MNPSAPKRIRKSKDLLGVSAVTFLVLCVGLGPRLACSLLFVAAIVTVWILAAKRWPWFAVFSAGFIRGLFSRR